MPSHGYLSDTSTTWKHYIVFLLKHQLRSRTAFIGILIAVLLIKIVAFKQYSSWWEAAVAILILLVTTNDLLEHVRRYRLAEGAKIKRSMIINLSDEEKVDLMYLLPSMRQRELGFEPKLSGNERIFASDSLDATLRTNDWAVILDTSTPRRIADVIRKHRDHCLGYLTIQVREAIKEHALLTNDRKLCLGGELSGKLVRCHEGGYFDSLCTNEASTAVITSSHRLSKSSGDESLFPIANGIQGYYLEDLDSANVNNHIGISCLAITSDRYFVLWQQTKKNIQDPGKVVSTGSGSCDFTDLVRSSLLNTIACAMERELREESKLRAPNGAASSNPHLVAETNVIGFFRWIQRGGKPEFIGISRLSVALRDLEPDDVEVGNIHALTKAGSPIKLENFFHVKTPDDVPKVVTQIKDLFSGSGNLQAIPLSLPLLRIFNVLELLYSKDPQGLREILYGQ